jgi:hypothetical protein
MIYFIILIIIFILILCYLKRMWPINSFKSELKKGIKSFKKDRMRKL